MYGTVRRRLDEQFVLEEARGCCLYPSNEADRRSLKRAAEDVADVNAASYRSAKKGVPEYVTVFPRLYLRGEYWLGLKEDELALHIIRTLARRHPDWVFCGTSAALLHRLDVPWDLLNKIHVASPFGGKRSLGGRLIRHVLPEGVCHAAGRLPAVDVREAVLESVCTNPFELGLGIADSALHLRRIGKAGLEAYFDVLGKSRKGIRRGRAVLSYADGRAENGGESRARAVMIEQGYAPHELQVPFSDPMDPSYIMRGDFGWLLEGGYWIIGELDGREKYENPLMMNGGDITDVMMAERMRESRLSAYGTRIMRFPFSYAVDCWKLIQLMQIFGVPRSEIPVIP